MWGTHPDTMCMSGARIIANETGYNPESYEWKKAYRDAYEQYSGERGAKKYLDQLDEELRAMLDSKKEVK